MCNANTRNKIYLLHIRTDIRREKNGNTQNITSASWPCRVRVNARVVPFSFWFCWFFCGCFDFSLSYVLPKRFETATKDFNFAKRVCVCWWFAEQKTTSLKEQFSFCTQVELIERCECAVRSAVLFLLYCAQFTVTTTNSNTRPKNKNFNEILRSQFTILRLHLYVRVCFRCIWCLYIFTATNKRTVQYKHYGYPLMLLLPTKTKTIWSSRAHEQLSASAKTL